VKPRGGEGIASTNRAVSPRELVTSRVRSVSAVGNEPSELAPTAFATEYQAAKRVLEIRFVKELEGSRKVQVDLLEGIHGTDGQPLEPWTLTFDTAG